MGNGMRHGDSWLGESLHQRVVALILAGECATLWRSLDRMASRERKMTVLRCAGPPEEILSLSDRLRPAVLLLDEQTFRKLLGTSWPRENNAISGLRILLTSAKEVQSDLMELESLLRAGCWGVLRPDVAPRIVWRAAQAIAEGQFWVSRATLTQIVCRQMIADSLGLTAREWEILRLVAQGYRNQQIAEKLFISVETVRWHLRCLYNKLGVHDRLSAAMQAFGLFQQAAQLLPDNGAPKTLGRLESVPS